MEGQISKRSRGKKWIFFIPVAVAIALVLAFAVMQLWNWILPDITGVKTLSYLQALGLLVLSRILFGNFGKGGFKGRPGFTRGSEMREKWVNMEPDERDKFKAEWKERCKSRENKPSS